MHHQIETMSFNTVWNAETLLRFGSICVVAQIKTRKWLWTISTAILE